MLISLNTSQFMRFNFSSHEDVCRIMFVFFLLQSADICLSDI